LDRCFLVAVLEKDPETRGEALAALHREHVVAVGLPDIAETRTVFEHIRPRVVLLDVEAPDEEELALARALRAADTSGTLSLVLAGCVPEQTLSVEMCGLVDVYVRKPADWGSVARVVVSLATDRRPPSTGHRLLRPA
jgi:DNA-binding response OmpR family regulator